MINIEKELVIGYIEDEFTALLEEINDLIITLEDRLLLSGPGNIGDTANLEIRLDRIKRAVKSLEI